MYRLLLLLLLALQPAPLSARWDGPGRATITWEGSGCLYRNQVLIGCYPRDASYVLDLGGPNTDGAYRPTGAPDEVFRLVRDGQEVARVRLRSVVYLAAVY